MDRDFPWMWSEACAMLMQAERMHREFFRPAGAGAMLPAWEPPVDILEPDQPVVVFLPLPVVSAHRVEPVIDGADRPIHGTRGLPGDLGTAVIHRLELPQGRFQRRVRLPAGRYAGVRRTAVDGCLVITLEKMEASRG